ncbi:hypothetical protein HYQ44_007095 [Verticillium longisporum]|nr:hypothetical protein HYQ44_007095 [Verticillium longisporum]
MTWQRASEAWTRSGSAPLRTHLSHPNRDKLNAGPCQCDAPRSVGILESMADVEMTEIPIPPPVMQQAPGPQSSYPPSSPPPQHPSPNSHQSYYDPKFGGYVQNYQQTPSPGNDAYSPGFQQQQQQQAQFGQQQTSPGGYYPAGAAVPDRQDTTSPSSLSGSTAHRLSTVAPTSPGSVQGGGAYQQGAPVYGHQGQTQPTIHEAPNGGDHHRGQMHEMA